MKPTRSYSDKKKLFKAIKPLKTVKIFIDASANMGIRNIIFVFCGINLKMKMLERSLLYTPDIS